MIAVSGYVYVVIYWACILLGVVALIDAARHRADAYPAADRRTKNFWLALLGGGLLAQFIFPALGGAGPLSILGLAGIVASIVYLVDVRRRLAEVTRGPRW
jgi:fructose-specific phosphotransferase system IIC component